MPPSLRAPSSATLPSLPLLLTERLATPSTSDDYVLLVAHHVSQQFLNEGRFVADASGTLRLSVGWQKAAAATSRSVRTRSLTASGSDTSPSVSLIVREISMNPVDCVEGKHELSSRPPSAVPQHKHHKARSKIGSALETQCAVTDRDDVLLTNPLLIQTVDEQILYDKVVFLTHIAVFARLPLSTLIHMSAALDQVMFDSQEALTFQDDEDSAVYMIISGTVVAKVNHDSITDRRRTKDGDRTIHEGKRRYLATRRHHYIDVVTFGAYGICGDEAIIGHKVRLYSLIATSQVSAYAINFAQLWQLVDSNTQVLMHDMAQYNHAVRQRTILLASKRSAAFKDSPIAFQHFLDQKVHRKLQHRNAEPTQLPPSMLISRPGSRRYHPEHSGDGAVGYFVQASVNLQLTKNATDNEATPTRLRHKLDALQSDNVERIKLKPITIELKTQQNLLETIHANSPRQADIILPVLVMAAPTPLPLLQPSEPIVSSAVTAALNTLHIVEDAVSHDRFITPKLFIPSSDAEVKLDVASLSSRSNTNTTAPPLILSIFDDSEVMKPEGESCESVDSVVTTSLSPARSVYASHPSSVSTSNHRPFALSTISFSSKVRRKAFAPESGGDEKKDLPFVSLRSVVAVSRALLESGDINNSLVDPRIRALYFFGDKNKHRQRPRRH